MSFALVTPPIVEPLTVDEVAAHLRLGSSNKEPRPDAPLAVLANAGPGDVDDGAHRYRCTFVTADGETDGGQISDVVTVADQTTNGQVSLLNVPLGGSQVTARKIYRTKANADEFFLVAAIANNTATTFTDTIADASLGVGAPVTNTTGDPLLLAFIRAAREYAERRIHHALVTQTWRLSLDCFPCGDTIELPIAPLQSVESFRYANSAGALVDVDADDYTVDTDASPGRIVRAFSTAWPAARVQRNAVVITFRAGFGDAPASVPSSITAGMKLLIGHWYENREAVNIGNIVNTIPMSVDALFGLWSRPAMEMA